jgi:DNA-binding response OmpR family regulator
MSSFRDAIEAAQTSRELVEILERALEPLADPRLAPKIARLAFDALDEPFDSSDRQSVALFVRGPLAQAVAEVINPGAVGAICDFVERVTSRWSSTPAPDESGVVPRPEAKASTLPTGPRPLVVLVSLDEELRDELDPWLSEAGFALIWCTEVDILVPQCATIEPHVVLLDDDTLGAERNHAVELLRHRLAHNAPRILAVGSERSPLMASLDGYIARPLQRRSLVELVNGVEPSGRDLPRRDDRRTAVDEGGRLRFLLDEALDRLVATSVRDAVVGKAVSCAGLERVPDDIEPFARFVVGPLHQAVADALGVDVADAVISDLEPLVLQARESSGVQEGDLPAPPDSHVRLNDGPSLLVVDDDERVRKALARGLIELGYRVKTVGDSHAAMDFCAEELPDALIIDLRMPGISGRQLCALLALQYGDAAPPVLVVTGDSEAGEVEGAAAVLIKPVRPTRLAEELARLQVAGAR